MECYERFSTEANGAVRWTINPQKDWTAAAAYSCPFFERFGLFTQRPSRFFLKYPRLNVLTSCVKIKEFLLVHGSLSAGSGVFLGQLKAVSCMKPPVKPILRDTPFRCHELPRHTGEQVSRPLDFSTIRKRQQKGRYAKLGISKLWQDIATVYKNAQLFNQVLFYSMRHVCVCLPKPGYIYYYTVYFLLCAVYEFLQYKK